MSLKWDLVFSFNSVSNDPKFELQSIIQAVEFKDANDLKAPLLQADLIIIDLFELSLQKNASNFTAALVKRKLHMFVNSNEMFQKLWSIVCLTYL